MVEVDSINLYDTPFVGADVVLFVTVPNKDDLSSSHTQRHCFDFITPEEVRTLFNNPVHLIEFKLTSNQKTNQI